ncbi:MAG: M14 family metallopeptidase [Candidatus Aminicenantes bacterium]|nr:M14 family metallopeptidase [Candidatus Aminicenantes bacterium]
MYPRTTGLFLALLFFISHLFSANSVKDFLTVAETSGYSRTSSHEEVMNLVQRLQASSSRVRVIHMATSTEGRMIPLVVVSRDGIASPGSMRPDNRSCVLINANIHAGEVEGKAAALMLIRDLALSSTDNLLQDQVLLIVPDFNPDGNDRFGRNRGDNGPELAGIRANAQNLDLNRDFLKLESPEVRGLVRVLRHWDPVLFVDLHTTNGSYHREPITFTTLSNPNSDPALRNYMWKTMFPAVQETLKREYGYDSVPYGNFRDRSQPQKGWANHAFGALYSTNYVGLRNRFTILDENYSHADFRTRVLSCHAFLRAVITHTAKHLPQMRRMADEADSRTVNAFPRSEFVLDYEVVPLLDFVLKSYRFEITPIPPEEKSKYPPWYGDSIVRPTDEYRDYPLKYYADTRATRTRTLPRAYLLEPAFRDSAQLLQSHGLVVEKTDLDMEMEVEIFSLSRVEIKPDLFQGHAPIRVEGEYKTETRRIPAGTWWISLRQPLARLVPELLEPDAAHGLLQWGHFTRVIQRQWSNRPGDYPVMRVKKIPPGLSRMVTGTDPPPLP